MTEILVISIVALTLALILVRPHGISEAWVAAGGAIAMIVLGPLQLRDVEDVLRETSDVLLFLAGMMVLTAMVERAGVFDLLAEGCARLARGSGILLFCLVFLLGAIVTGLLSLDVTVVVLTPIIYAVTLRRRLNALPFMFACTFVANTASLIFPVSNLTNLLVYNQLDIAFPAFARNMWIPNVSAVVANVLIFLWFFRDQLPRRFEMAATSPLPSVDWWMIVAAIVLISTLIALFALGLAHRPLAWAAVCGAIVLFAIGRAADKIEVRSIAGDVSWTVLVYVVGMLVTVRGIERGWIEGIDIAGPSNPTHALFAGVAASAIGSNVINNVPMTLLSIPVIERTTGPAREALAYGVLVGSNIGPTLTTYGSLATMLWLAIIRKRGLDISTREYLRVGLVCTPPVLFAASIALFLVLR